MGKKYDVVALGEVLIDFTPAPAGDMNVPAFLQNPGGAPANVLVSLSRLGKGAAFIGKVGNDQFGHFLKTVLDGEKVDTEGLVFAKEVNTTLAFVHLDDKGDRSFSFYRNPGADMTLSWEEVNKEIICNASIFHFGSVSMTHEPARSATLEAARFAKNNGLLISYDPNLRPALWDSLENAKAAILKGMEYADVVKISDEELYFLTDTTSLEDGSKALCDEFEIKLLFTTLGPEGCFYRYGDTAGKLETYDVKTVDTTGAGDAFLGGALYKLLENSDNLQHLNEDAVRDIVDFANATGALATTRKGAIPAMPELKEILNLMGLGT